MLYRSHKKGFRQHVHPSLQRRIRVFIVVGVGLFAVVVRDILGGVMGLPLALAAVVVGFAVGWATSRIFHLSWSRDSVVVSRIDKIGAAVLAVYIIFEIARAMLFETVIHTGYASTAITFAFVSAALVGRVVGLRGRIIDILKREKIFG